MRRFLIALLAFPLASLGANPPTPAERAAANQKRVQNDMHLLRIIGLADALGLSEAEALRLDRIMHPFDERKREVRVQINEAAKVIQRATEGDSAALARVDQAMETVLSGRVLVAEIDKEMIQAVAREITPQQRAKMSVFFAKYGQQARQMAAQAQKLRQAQQQNNGQQNKGN